MNASSIRICAVRRAHLSGCFVFLCLVAARSHATVVVSNLSDPYEVGFGIQSPANAAAGSFTTAAGQYSLSSVSVAVQGNSLGSSELRLRADNSGSPGALLESLGTDVINTGQSLLTYSSSGTLLNPATTYWLTMGETGSGDVQWDGTFSTAESSPVSWTIGNQTFNSQNGGASWQQINAGPPNSAPLFSVNARIIPEPSTLVLAAFGFVGLAAWGWIRRRRTIAVAGFAILVLLGVCGPPSNAGTISSLFSTGVDNNGVPLPDGPIGAGAIGDPHYFLLSVPSGTTLQTDVFTFTGQWLARNTDTTSTWIAPNQNTSAGGPQGAPQGDYDYQTHFDLTGLNPASASITGNWAADNYGFDILINGLSTGNTTQTTSDASFTHFHSFNISDSFIPGINTLDFLVRNFNGPGDNATGLRVEILSATANIVPEPSSWVLLGLGAAGVFLATRRRRPTLSTLLLAVTALLGPACRWSESVSSWIVSFPGAGPMKTTLRALGLTVLSLGVTASVRASVLPAVGYMNRTFESGDSLFANPLDNFPNTLSTLFATVPDGTSISFWNSTMKSFDTTSTFVDGAWSIDLLLNPGTGARLTAPSTFVITFIGEVLSHDGGPFADPYTLPPVFSGPNGLYLLGDKAPVSSTGTDIFLNILGRIPNIGEQVGTLSSTSTYLGGGNWDLVSSLAISEAVFLNVGPPVPEPAMATLAVLAGLTLLPWCRRLRRNPRVFLRTCLKRSCGT